MEKAIIEVKNLSHRFSDGSYAFRDLDLIIRKGDFTVITGKNGSGKTILMKHLNGLLSPESGSVLFDGKDIKTNLLKVRQKIGLVFQSPDSQILGQTVKDDIAFGPKNLGLSRGEIEDRVNMAMEKTGLTAFANKQPHYLSGGEKRRLSIAGVLAMNPDVIVLDEPFVNLDYPGQRQVTGQILDLYNAGHTIIIVTHELEAVLAYATLFIIMESGSIVFSGKPDDGLSVLNKYQIRKPYGEDRPIKTMTWLN